MVTAAERSPDIQTTIPLRDGGTVPAVTVAVWNGAQSPAATVVLAHGAGSSLRHDVHAGVCAAVAAAGPRVVSFNFPYAEAGRRSPDRMPRLLSCWRDVLGWARTEFTPAVLVAGGRSMGGRAASLLEAEEHTVDGLALLNYPLLPVSARAGAAPRTGHWPQLRVPVLFVHGARDRLMPLEKFRASLPLLHAAPVAVHVVDHADHGFAVPKSTGRTRDDVWREVGAAVATWLSRLAAADAAQVRVAEPGVVLQAVAEQAVHADMGEPHERDRLQQGGPRP